MKSVLIRFTDKRYVKSYLKGDLYMSSLSKFWDIKNRFEEQKDICEGVAATVPNKNLGFPSEFESALVYDARYRLTAYEYCNLLCFFRVDVDGGSIQLPSKEMDMSDTIK